MHENPATRSPVESGGVDLPHPPCTPAPAGYVPSVVNGVEAQTMVRFTVHTLGEHTIDNMVVTGPCKEIIMEMAELFLASYTGPVNGDLDYPFAEYIIKFSQGQGRILEWTPTPPADIH